MGVGVLGVAALLTFFDLARALAVAGVCLVVSFLEGNLIFFLWGIPGALLAVPTLAIFKIICDHVDTLAPIGEFFGPADEG